MAAIDNHAPPVHVAAMTAQERAEAVATPWAILDTQTKGDA